MTHVAFVGLGVMGGPMATNLLSSGQHKLTVYDIDPDKSRVLGEGGARMADSVQEACEQADVVMTSLPGPVQVEQVALAEDGLLASMQPGSLWIDLSTNNLTVCALVAERARARKVGFVDAPVSGGDEGARAGSLAVLVGGSDEHVKSAMPLLEIIGSDIRHLGPNGAGYSAKIAQVVLCYLHSLALSEALMLGISGGVDPDSMLDIIRNSTGRSYVADRYGPEILNGSYDPSFTVGLAHKDMKLAMEMADNLGISLPMCDLTTRTYNRAVKTYGFDANHLKSVRLLEEANTVMLRGGDGHDHEKD